MLPVVAISIVIPTHERRDLVRRAIGSVLDQHRSPVDVVVVDDGSTDGTAAAVEELGVEAVRVLRQDNRGPSAARNAAVAECRGDVVAFLDSDNTWFPHHLGYVAELFNLHSEAALVATQRNYAFGDETPSQATVRDMANPLLLNVEGVAVLSAVAVRRAAFLEAGGFDERLWYGEDNDLFLRLALLGPFACIAARTVRVSSDATGLRQRGMSTGGYAPLLVASAQNATVALDTCARPDTARLRRSASARLALGRAVLALHDDEPVAVVRAHLAAAIDNGPAPGDVAAWVDRHLHRVGGWNDAQRRLVIRMKTARAWPLRGRSRAQVHLWAAREALRQRRLVEAARLAPGYLTPSGAAIGARGLAVRSPLRRQRRRVSG